MGNNGSQHSFKDISEFRNEYPHCQYLIDQQQSINYLDPDSHRVIKVIPKNALTPQRSQAIQRELFVMRKLADHENILKLYDAYASQKNIFLVMEQPVIDKSNSKKTSYDFVDQN